MQAAAAASSSSAYAAAAASSEHLSVVDEAYLARFHPTSPLHIRRAALARRDQAAAAAAAAAASRPMRRRLFVDTTGSDSDCEPMEGYTGRSPSYHPESPSYSPTPASPTPRYNFNQAVKAMKQAEKEVDKVEAELKAKGVELAKVKRTLVTATIACSVSRKALQLELDAAANKAIEIPGKASIQSLKAAKRKIDKLIEDKERDVEEDAREGKHQRLDIAPDQCEDCLNVDIMHKHFGDETGVVYCRACYARKRDD